jgi:hypothetical protein
MYKYQTLEELGTAFDNEEYDPETCEAYVDSNELIVYGPGGEKLFSGVVGPRDVAWLLRIEQVNNV